MGERACDRCNAPVGFVVCEECRDEMLVGENESLRHQVSETTKQIEAVKSLHAKFIVYDNDPKGCLACITQLWPCPTLRALGVTGDNNE